MEVVSFPPRANNIPAMLRLLADDIEAGTYGEVVEAAMVLNAESLEVFGWGKMLDATSTHYLLGCAMSRLQSAMVKQFYFRTPE